MPAPAQPAHPDLPHDDLPIREAAWAELDATTTYRIAALRAAVFVVEQQCCYLDLDGRDLEPDARHLFITGPGGTVLAALRVLAEADGGHRIGRVVTDPAHRGQGLAARLLLAALQRRGPFVLDAQSHLSDWYAGFGFEVCGAEFVEDGIPHLPMQRP